MAIRVSNDYDFNGFKVTNLADPTMPSHAATRSYVDAVAVGLSWRPPVQAASDVNENLATPDTIDGVTPAAGQRYLLMGQTDPAENGIYVFSNGSLIRAADEIRSGTAVVVQQGDTHADQAYNMVADTTPFVLGSTAQTWTVFNAGGVPTYVEGDGIDINNYQVRAVAAPSGGVAVTASGIGIVVDAASALELGPAGLAVLAADTSVTVDSSGVAVNPAPNDYLTTGAGGLAVRVDPAGGLHGATALGLAIHGGDGLTVDATSARVRAGNGVSVDAAGVAALADPAGGLAVTGAGIAGKAGNTAVTVDASGIGVVADPDGALTVDPAGLGVVATPAGGLTVDATGVAVKAGNAVRVDATGVWVLAAPAGGVIADANGVALVPAPDGGLSVAADGARVDVTTGGGLTTDTNGLAVQVDTAKGLEVTGTGIGAVAGEGISVSAAGIAVDTSRVCRKTEHTLGDGTATDIPLPHNLGTYFVGVELFDSSGARATVQPEVERPDDNTVLLRFGRPPTAGQFNAVVWG